MARKIGEWIDLDGNRRETWEIGDGVTILSGESLTLRRPVQRPPIKRMPKRLSRLLDVLGIVSVFGFLYWITRLVKWWEENNG